MGSPDDFFPELEPISELPELEANGDDHSNLEPIEIQINSSPELEPTDSIVSISQLTTMFRPVRKRKLEVTTLEQRKTCCRCKVSLLLDAYHKDASGTFGVRGTCKFCAKKLTRECAMSQYLYY